MLSLTLVVLLSASPVASCCGPQNCLHAEPGPFTRVFDSASFHVESYAAGCDARNLAECCESWRRHLHGQWLGGEAAADWNPRCTVVVHARRETYRAAIGRGGEQTFGSSQIDLRSGQTSRRRIDLLLDSRGAISALGHELTHVVIADAFPGREPPLWAGEGIAMLADSADKQRLHRRDLVQSLQSRSGFHCAELLQSAAYPRPERMAAFYAHSASLTSFLVEAGGAEKFVPFVKRASEVGYDRALAEVWGIGSMAELQRRWESQLRANGESAPAGAARTATVSTDRPG
jgi:hypothetical protein